MNKIIKEYVAGDNFLGYIVDDNVSTTLLPASPSELTLTASGIKAAIAEKAKMNDARQKLGVIRLIVSAMEHMVEIDASYVAKIHVGSVQKDNDFIIAIMEDLQEGGFFPKYDAANSYISFALVD